MSCGELLAVADEAFARLLAGHRAKMEAENELLRREAWQANAPLRAAAELFRR